MVTWSPRRRGWTGQPRLAVGAVLVVPAQAGVDRARVMAPPARTCGPRAGGGGPAGIALFGGLWTWSPRRRGWTGGLPGTRQTARVVPAQAGVDRRRRRGGRTAARGPRAGGGGPYVVGGAVQSAPWSPRRRGWTAAAGAPGGAGPVVPAQAGVDRARLPQPVGRLRGPRAGGGGPPRGVAAVERGQWSPRRRGWTAHRRRQRRLLRVVPAQAGVDQPVRAALCPDERGPRAGGGGLWEFSPAFFSLWSPRRRGWTGRFGLLYARMSVVPA